MMKKLISKRVFGLLSVLLMIPFWVCAQNITVSGVVSDIAGEPLPGVNVSQKGVAKGVVTDIDGKYITSVPANATLVFAYVGYSVKEVAVNGATTLNVTLNEDNQLLSEVVVVGYGSMKRSDITGSVATVNAEDMMKRVPTNVSQGLQGAAPGVIVTMQDGAPDSRAQVRIRGVATINGSAAPLYVVDGIQVGNNADFVAPNDIESIDVLKDASATAIYGAAGANGVIMITTKHGAKGHASVSLTADFGLQTVSSKLDVCGVDQYAANLRQARINDIGAANMWNPIWTEAYDGKRKAQDWQDIMTHNAWRQNYNISTSGGNDKSQYHASVGFLRNDGIVVNTQYQRLTVRANAHTQINKYLEFGADVSYVHSDSHGSNVSVGNFGNLSSMRDFAFACPSMDFITSEVVTYDGVPAGTHISPNVVNPDGSYGEVAGGKNFNDGMWGTTLGNMYAKQMENNGRNRSNRSLASAYLAITPFDGLTWKTLVSYDYNSSSSNNFSGGIYVKRANYVDGQLINVVSGLAGTNSGNDAYYKPRNNNEYEFNVSNSESQTLYIQNTLTYHWQNGVNDLTLMLGNEVSRWYGQWASANAIGFESPNNRDISLTTNWGDNRKGYGALNLETRGISYFGRLTYALMDRYLLTATLRRDGSSNFGAGNRWGTFPSAAIGWRISEEGFLKDSEWLNNLKLRAGWGQTGNSGGATDLSVNGLNVNGKYVYYPAGASMGLGTGNPNVVKGFYPVLKDAKLKWETNEQTNIGIDLAFLNNEFQISADYFIRTSKDLLLYRQIRPTSGYSQLYSNYGEIENKGIEIMVNWNKRINKDLSFSATLTGSTLKNKVKKMGDPIYNTNSDSSSNANPTGDGSNTGAIGAPDGYHWGNHSICKEGEAVGSFYGYRVEGIIRNDADLAYVHNRPVFDAEGQPVWKTDDDGNLVLDEKGNKIQKTADSQEKAKIGDYIFKDLNGDGIINEQDMDILGHGFPKLNFGLNLTVNYKNFDLSIQTHGVVGQKIYSYSAMRLSNMFSSDDGCAPNLLKEAAAAAWSPSNPDGTLARLSFLDENYNMRGSDAWVKNGDFFKISNLQIGYTIPRNICNAALIQNARVYLAIQNLACFSKYNKYGDPECGQGSVLYTGLDTGRYPMPRTYAFGLNVTF